MNVISNPGEWRDIERIGLPAKIDKYPELAAIIINNTFNTVAGWRLPGPCRFGPGRHFVRFAVRGNKGDKRFIAFFLGNGANLLI